MKKLIIGLSAMLVLVACDAPVENQPNEINEIEMMLSSVQNTDVPSTLSKGSGGDKHRKASFRKVIHRINRYLKKNPNDEAQLLMESVKSNMKLIREKHKNRDKDGLRELVKETRGLLKDVLQIIKSSK
ncbi:MAG: hypothetical protein H8E03_00490 [Pelagibacteraceae bacterium]|nr:hypothetical protein [Pelagibacteraceae bacterium]